MGAYQLQPNLSLGGLIDQADQELPSNYQDTRNEPTVGLFAAYSGTYAGREYTAKLSAAYNNENYNITRDVLTNTEAGTGSSSIACSCSGRPRISLRNPMGEGVWGSVARPML